MGQLAEEEYGGMSAAKAALQGGMGWVHGQMYCQDGRHIRRFSQTATPDTGPLTSASVRGLGTFETDDAAEAAAGLAHAAGTATVEAARSV